MKVFRVVTSNFLTHSKRNYDSLEECVEHIKRIIAKKPKWITPEDEINSWHVTVLETDDYNGLFEKIYPESLNEIEANAPSIREMKLRKII